MGSEPKTSNPEIQKPKESPTNTGVSRETIAQKLRLKVDDIPVMASYEKIQGMLGELEGEVKEKKGEARVTLLKQRLNEISLKEAADKASEVANDAAKKAKEIAPQALNSAVQTAQDVLKQTGREGMKGAMQSISDMANSGGDLNKLSKGIDGLTKTVDTTSKGVSGVFESLGGAIKGLLEALGFMGLFRSIGRFFGMDVLENSGEDKTEMPKKTGEITGKAQDMANPEKMKSNIEVMKEKYWNAFIQSGWIQDPKTQEKKFTQIFEEYSKKGLIDVKEVGENLADPNKIHNPAGKILEVTTMPFRFVLRLISDGVIPKSAIFSEVADQTGKGLKLYIRSPYTLVTKGPSQVIFDLGVLGDRDFASMTEPEKRVVINAMHNTMTGPLWLAGKSTALMAKISLLGTYWDQGIGFEKGWAMLENTRGDFSKGAERMEYIMKMLGDQSGVNELQKYKDFLRGATDEMMFKTQISETFTRLSKQGKTSIQIADAIESMKGFEGYKNSTEFQRLLSELRTHAIARSTEVLSSFTTYITTPINKRIALDGVTELKAIFNNFHNLGELELIQARASEQMGLHLKTLSQMVQRSETPVWNAFNKLRLGISQAELMDAFEKGHLQVHVKNATDAKSAMEQIVKAIPKGFEHVFNGLAISLVVADTLQQVHNQDESKGSSGDIAWNALKGIASLSPLYAGPIMIYEGIELKGSIPQKSGYLAMGGVLSVIAGRDIARVIANPSFATTGRLLFSPIITLGETAGAVVRGSRLAYNGVRFSPGLSRIPKFRAGGFLTLGAILGYLTYEKMLSDNTQKTMKNAGFFTKDGNMVHGDDLKQAWSRVPVGEQPKILSDILSRVFDGSGIKTTVNSDNSTLVHTIPSNEVGIMPVTLDTFEAVQSIYAGLGIKEPKVYMSESTTESVKKAIAELPVSDEKKQEFLKKFIG